MLRRWLKRTGMALSGLSAAAALAYAGVHCHVERLMRVSPVALSADLARGNAMEGERLARVLGCRSCHDQDLGGRVFSDIPHAALLVASNLSTAMPGYSDADFIRLMRTGAKRDGRLALVMPTKGFQRLSDQELADLLAYLRSVPRVERELPPTRIRPLGKIAASLGHYDTSSMRADPPESAAVLADRQHSDPGRRLLLLACGECHGMDFAGHPDEGIPPLRVVLAYDEVEFARLMREGITKSGSESATGLMTRTARNRFAVLSDAEIAAMRDYILGHPQ
jgi:cytochrome c553